MSTAELLALEVLKGNLSAARGLCDLLLEEYRQGGVELPPVRKVGVPVGRLRVAFFFTGGEPSAEAVARFCAGIRDWLAGKSPAMIVPFDGRLELYEMPESGKESE